MDSYDEISSSDCHAAYSYLSSNTDLVCFVGDHVTKVICRNGRVFILGSEVINFAEFESIWERSGIKFIIPQNATKINGLRKQPIKKYIVRGGRRILVPRRCCQPNVHRGRKRCLGLAEYAVVDPKEPTSWKYRCEEHKDGMTARQEAAKVELVIQSIVQPWQEIHDTHSLMLGADVIVKGIAKKCKVVGYSTATCMFICMPEGTSLEVEVLAQHIYRVIT